MLTTLLFLGCPKTTIPAPTPDDLSGTRWSGILHVTQACEVGGYTGDDLKICIRLSGPADALHADVDWDSTALRDDCAYFAFDGNISGEMINLTRTDEPTTTMELRYLGEALHGSFSVDPSCGQWPVVLMRTE